MSNENNIKCEHYCRLLNYLLGIGMSDSICTLSLRAVYHSNSSPFCPMYIHLITSASLLHKD